MDFVNKLEKLLIPAIPVGPDSHWLLIGAVFVGEFGGFYNPFKFSPELVFGINLSANSNLSISGEVYYNLICNTGFLRAFTGGGNSDLKIFLLFSDLVGDKEKNQKEKDNINHGGQLEAGGWRIVIANSHDVRAFFDS